MEIKITNVILYDINEKIEKIYWEQLDFSFVPLLKGNKDLLGLCFRETKKELLNG
jgi:hypothetical protein